MSKTDKVAKWSKNTENHKNTEDNSLFACGFSFFWSYYNPFKIFRKLDFMTSYELRCYVSVDASPFCQVIASNIGKFLKLFDCFNATRRWNNVKNVLKVLYLLAAGAFLWSFSILLSFSSFHDLLTTHNFHQTDVHIFVRLSWNSTSWITYQCYSLKISVYQNLFY